MALSFLTAVLAGADTEPVDWAMENRLRDEEFNHSQVMETLKHLTDIIGPRLTESGNRCPGSLRKTRAEKGRGARDGRPVLDCCESEGHRLRVSVTPFQSSPL